MTVALENVRRLWRGWAGNDTLSLPTQMGYSGYKHLTHDNWLDPDPASRMFVKVSETGVARPMSGEDRLAPILEPQLENYVPADIHSLFDAARGCMAYGYFYYPLFSVGQQHLYKALEGAVRRKCRDAGYPKSGGRALRAKLEWMEREGHLSSQGRFQWDLVRRLRNSFSHPDFNSTVPPGTALGNLRLAAAQINELFRAGAQPEEQPEPSP